MTKVKRNDIEKTFEALIKQEENQKNKNYSDFLEDSFEIDGQDEALTKEIDYLGEYNRKYGSFSKFLSVLIYILIVIIIYQIITIISFYV